MRTHYETLQVDERASPEELYAAYKALSDKWLPDRHPDNSEMAESRFREINRAYLILSDPVLREQYDKLTGVSLFREDPSVELITADDIRRGQAEAEGREAYRQGLQLSDCPYGGALAESWSSGFSKTELVDRIQFGGRKEPVVKVPSARYWEKNAQPTKRNESVLSILIGWLIFLFLFGAFFYVWQLIFGPPQNQYW
ncbi:J domain-containing protein [Pseudomonas sp. PI1]|uniref:J domain-containing protein n=1 Tax=Pseudomonas sp. PI1 TaxID=1582493 RepID=UPI0009E2B18E|nr:J domain-containing protein [Pseudomonas sp. PI1]